MSTTDDAPDDTAVLVPVKAFRAAKARLTGTLEPPARRALARWMADRVVAAAGPLPVFVACDDDEVADWADGLGAEVLWSPGLGLNGAVDTGAATIAGKGFGHVVISHGDLPLAVSLTTVVRAGTTVIVPDRRRDGTNVLARPCAIDIPASYGAGSYRRHLDHALAAGGPVMVRTDAELSLDLDTVTDLRHPLVWPLVRGMIET
ncbi:MAG: 2-phospho-L-lactate guanylyltransferase [Ilumatobacteraceae bacterium]